MGTSSEESRKNSPSGAAAAPAMALDIVGREMAERELRLSEQNYRLLIEEAPYAICRATDSGQLLQVNRSMIEMLGYSPGCEADLLIRDLPLIFVDSDGFDRFRQSLLHGGAVQGLDSAWLCRDGRQIQVRIGGRRVSGPLGETLYFDLLAENVTERKELEARLAQAEKMQAIGQLAGGIAHDFNNLLTVINGYCDLLLVEEEDGSRRRNLEMIRRAGERAAGLTQQLLAFSRKQLTRTEAVNLNAIVAEVVQLSRRLIGENIRVVEELCGTGTVLADAAQIHQMLMNLVINARDAMPEGGLLLIATSAVDIGASLAGQLDIASGPYVELTVTDSGVGMDDSVRAHIFEPFFTTKSVGKGTGLGLSTVYGMVRQCHGGIAVESRPGAGTTFRIYLPQFLPSEDAIPPGMAVRALVRGASTVLVVEDEDAVRRLIVDLLQDSGYDVLEAANAEEAMAIGAGYAGAIHLLLTDMVMPGMNGRKLAEGLRNLHPESKVLLVSGYSESLVSADPLDKSIRYLQKPFTPEHLTRVVNEAIAEDR
jgi:two-component system, cell cycle sensor histidine kinase and response regulator CckA